MLHEGTPPCGGDLQEMDDPCVTGLTMLMLHTAFQYHSDGWDACQVRRLMWQKQSCMHTR